AARVRCGRWRPDPRGHVLRGPPDHRRPPPGPQQPPPGRISWPGARRDGRPAGHLRRVDQDAAGGPGERAGGHEPSIMTFVAGDNAPGGPRVAVLGLGIMGTGMARSLLRAGLPVDVWNRTPERAADVAVRGAVAHADPAGAVADAGVVITMLADATAVRSGGRDQGMLEGLRPGAIWAKMGTIGVATTEELAAVTAERRPDVAFVDAPVSGSRGPAEAGELAILAAGPEGVRAALEPVFGAVGQT